MKGKSLLGLFLVCCFSANPSFAALTISEINSATELANEILGIGTSNLTGSVYTGAINGVNSTYGTTGSFSQAGIFSGGLSVGLGFDSGIFLSTGHILDDTDPLTTDFGRNGDPDLASLLPNIAASRDAAVLEFTFNWQGGDLVFNYTFASEEYNNFVGQGFNDVFGFFIDGINIALTDNTPLVSVDSFNNNVNSDMYNDNTGGTFPNILFNGFTTTLTATAANLAAGTYTAKIGITDVGSGSMDGIIDSGVFIQSNSFSIPVPIPASLPLFLSALMGIGLVSRRKTH